MVLARSSAFSIQRALSNRAIWIIKSFLNLIIHYRDLETLSNTSIFI